jgi:hypothetical protein
MMNSQLYSDTNKLIKAPMKINWIRNDEIQSDIKSYKNHFCHICNLIYKFRENFSILRFSLK